MSVIRDLKRKGEFTKEHALSKKKQKRSQGQKAKIDSVIQKGDKANSKVMSPMKFDIMSNIDTGSKSKQSTDFANDKHSKLKNRKKFKQLKALKGKKNAVTGTKVQVTKPSVKKSTAEEVKSSLTAASKRKNKKLERKLKKDLEKNSDLKKKGNLKTGGGGSAEKGDGIETVNAHSTQKVVSEKKKLKRVIWKQKQMARKLKRKGLVNEHENKRVSNVVAGKVEHENKRVSNVVAEKVELPKPAEGGTSNWKNLQKTMSTQNSETKKRKIPEHRLRNPKYMKVEDRQEKKQTVDGDDIEKEEPEIWFDDVDEILLDRKPVSLKHEAGTAAEAGTEAEEGEANVANPLIKSGAFKGVTKIVGMDCEMVGVGDGKDSMLARVSIVNQYGESIYDRFVKPKEEVVDYRTSVSGVRPQDLENAEDFEQVQKDVADILNGKILVGHAIKNDLKVLYLSHARKRIRDTSLYKPFRQLSGGRTPSLKKLSEKILAVKVQEGEHNSVQDAQATMRLYTMVRKQWENEITKKKKETRGKKGGKT